MKPSWDRMPMIPHARPCISFGMFDRIITSQLMFTKGIAARNRKPEAVMKYTFVVVPIRLNAMPAMNRPAARMSA